MTEFYIRVLNGQPFEHPILGDNLREVFPDLDTENLPPEFAVFKRSDPRGVPVGFYEVLAEEYVWDGDVVRDNWHARPMTEEERAEKRHWGISAVEAQRGAFYTQAAEMLHGASEADSEIIRAYMADLAAYVFDDPADAVLPLPPRRQANGELLGTTGPGSAPDVVG